MILEFLSDIISNQIIKGLHLKFLLQMTILFKPRRQVIILEGEIILYRVELEKNDEKIGNKVKESIQLS